uniref:C2HC/C3H-type domain-containing protein n=1 Tax=Alexandrium monilatum TaxID=311494 RepID=A0A7S4V0I3_9DINO
MPPTLVVCHICGREFGRASIDIHIPQCAKKWEAAEAQKPERDRRPVPQRPDVAPGATQAEVNEALRQNWNDNVLEACPNCGRTFLPDRLQIHLRSCKAPPGGGGQTRAKSSTRQSSAPPGGRTSPAAEPRAERTPPRRPAFVVCHICGREFGKASIDIHIPQCEKKWEAAEAQKPKGERRPVPQRPELGPGMTQEQANDKVLQHWNDEVLEKCPNCGRTFLPDRLQVHLRSCKPKDGGRLPSPGPSRLQSPSPAASGERQRSSTPRQVRPKAVACHICGREFGTASIDIHIPQCAKKWEAAEAKKPPGQRRPVPEKPEIVAGMSLQEQNEKVTQHFNDRVLEACPNCGRTFQPDRLAVHLRSCTASSPAKARVRSSSAADHAANTAAAAEAGAASGVGREPPMKLPPAQPRPQAGTASAPMSREPSVPKLPPARPKTVVCHICGREFGSASIAIHMPQCEKKWLAAEAQKPPNERRPVPKRPELDPTLSREEANDKLTQHWNDKVLEPCPNCGRTFLPDRLEIHLRSCRPKTAGQAGPEVTRRPAATEGRPRSVGPSEEGRKAAAQGPPVRPRTVVCHICGREFGTASIDIHIPQCEKKWEAAEARKPEGQRRPVPQRPDVGGLSREEANDKLQQHWNDTVLERCPHCSRTFLPDRLVVHLRSCRPKE